MLTKATFWCALLANTKAQWLLDLINKINTQRKQQISRRLKITYSLIDLRWRHSASGNVVSVAPICKSWWRRQMETFSSLLTLCAGNHWSPMNSPHKGQWRGAFMFSLICVRINGWVNNREAGDLRGHLVHYDVTVMPYVNSGRPSSDGPKACIDAVLPRHDLFVR